MLPDRERDILRVQAKNLAIELRREHEANKLEGREDAKEIFTRTEAQTGGGASGFETESVPGGGGGESPKTEVPGTE